MKTQILHLEPHDDLFSAREKMGWSQAERILLVWPGRGRLLNRRLDLVLLQRLSQKRGAQLAFVTRDPEVRFHARQLSIPVYRTPTKAKKASWTTADRVGTSTDKFVRREGKPRPDLEALREAVHPPLPAWQQRKDARLAIFALGVLALLSIAAVLAPRAEIYLSPKTTSQEIILAVQARPEIEQASPLSGLIPARPLRVVVEGRDSLRSSGSISFPDGTAAGQILLTNLTDRPVTVPTGSKVRTLEDPAIRFTTTRQGSVAAGPGRSLSLPVLAMLPGKSGNIPAGSLAALEGPSGLSLTVTNPAPTRGGYDRRVPAPSQEDYESLEDGLRRSLRMTALEELSEQLEPGDVLLPSSLSSSQVIEQSFEPAEAQPADWLSLSLRLEFQVLVASGGDLRSLAEGVLDANLPEGYEEVPGSLQIQHITIPAAGQDGGIRWRLKAVRKLQAQIDGSQAVHQARGLSPSQVEQRLTAGLPLAAPPVIHLTPTWWPRLPWVPFRIEVKNQRIGD